jgi:hypothetical protein
MPADRGGRRRRRARLRESENPVTQFEA